MDERDARFDVLGPLGEGLHGEVLLAFDRSLGRKVALKRLKGKETGWSAQEEAQQFAHLNHPNIVQVYEISEYDGLSTLVLEFVEGTPLSDLIASGDMTLDNAGSLMTGLVSALSAAHATGLVHADIKPSNILIRPSGTPVLIDFSLSLSASLVPFAETEELPASTSMIRGAPDFMAPEVMAYATATSASDIYALGKVMLLVLDRSSEPVPQAKKLRHLLERMTAPNSSDRPSAEELSASNIDAYFRSGRPVWQWAATLSGIAAVILFFVIQQTPALSKAERLRAGFEALQHYEQDGALEDAEANFQSVLSNDSNSAAAYAGLGHTAVHDYYLADNSNATLERALNYAQQAVAIEPGLAVAQAALGRALAASGDHELAQEAFQRAMALDPNDYFTLEGYGEFLIAGGNYPDAIAHYQSAQAAYPQMPALASGEATALFYSGRLNEAANAYEAVVTRFPDYHFAYFSLGNVYYYLGCLQNAIQIAQQGLQISPSADLYNSLGAYYFEMQSYELSAEHFEQALGKKRNSDDELLWGNLGDAYRFLDNHDDKAEAAYLRAIDIIRETGLVERGDLDAISSAALYSAKAGRRDEAATFVNSFESLLDGTALADPNLSYAMAVTGVLLDDSDRAVRYFRAALDNGFPLGLLEADPELDTFRESGAFRELLLMFPEQKQAQKQAACP